jgi:hypothetical protein
MIYAYMSLRLRTVEIELEQVKSKLRLTQAEFSRMQSELNGLLQIVTKKEANY